MQALQQTLNKFLQPERKPRERDSQRSKLYAAERAARLGGDRFVTVADMERYVKSKFPRAALVGRYGTASDLRTALVEGRFTIKDGRGVRIARGCARFVKMPMWSRVEWILLHELAHAVHARLPANHALHGGAGHGWQYAAIYYDLIRFIMGREAGSRLKEQFKLHRVRMRPKRVGRPASAAALAGLAAARAARR